LLQNRKAEPSRPLVPYVRGDREQSIQPKLFLQDAPAFAAGRDLARRVLRGGRPAIDIPTPSLGQLPELIERHAHLLVF
jgi:hypothetical protein